MSALTITRRVLLSMVLVFTVLPAAAHEIRPTIADVEVGGDRVTMMLTVTLESLIAGIDLSEVENTNNAPEAAIYDRLRALGPVPLEAALRNAWPRIRQGFLIEVAGERLPPEIVSVAIPAVGNLDLPRDSILTVGADLPPGDAGVRLGLAPRFGTFIPRQIGAGEDAYEGFLDGGALTPEISRAQVLTEGAGALFLRYVGAGFEHIVPLGMDHILFVLGLFFFATQLGPLLWQVTAFTVAHTITLALAATGVVTVPASIVEPLIAATIVFVGIENTLGFGTVKGRTALVFVFGLLHGLGFASVLGDYGIASGRFLYALVGFNIGVEFGQLAVILIAFSLVGWFMSRAWYRKAIAIPASLVIACIGAWWVVERTIL
ncbi:Membrane protein [Roseibacterium elongatum DSM 19469]|uniref:Membrane protein n=1 Tax=Roseicyclus elongatus DSM 19469 TaxID=1294273 RepID=W8SM54_9RHOB|nr:HupE/UreJ family protein [Roseibacterium elongatum]AHM03625.1 Membrane protein [Roseibacterium elongatum DSM 19469]